LAHLATHPTGENLESANDLFFLCELCVLCGELLLLGSFAEGNVAADDRNGIARIARRQFGEPMKKTAELA